MKADFVTPGEDPGFVTPGEDPGFVTPGEDPGSIPAEIYGSRIRSGMTDRHDMSMFIVPNKLQSHARSLAPDQACPGPTPSRRRAP